MLANISQKNMDDHIAEVHEHPFRRRGAFSAEREVPLTGEDSVDVVCDSPNLPFRVSGTDDQVIGD